ncbi:unnamed protein product [Rodentolepis nana]|uniref:Ovule protein n=1 Tax=Rodentolepis nana TaxID=102285 RepID=A0A0R3TCM6_RODNA|nr:unnamed protein product [Rodentolepis nana]
MKHWSLPTPVFSLLGQSNLNHSPTPLRLPKQIQSMPQQRQDDDHENSSQIRPSQNLSASFPTSPNFPRRAENG